MMRRLMLGAAAALALAAGSATAEIAKPPAQSWSFDGVFGGFDRPALKRGLQIYNEICAGCHSLRLLSYRNLLAIGFSENEVKAVAAEFEVEDGPDEEGEMFTRPAKPSDRFASPFANEQAARAANSGALPPDLSVITKARKGGADYLYALLVGYKDEPPEGFELTDGMSYNEYFPGRQIAMAPPLTDETVEYTDGTKATLDQHARDVSVFLTWAAEPELEERKSLGIKVMLFLIVLTAMLYALKRRIWSDIH